MRVAFCLLFFCLFHQLLLAQSMDRRWQEIDSLEQKGLYRSALQKADEAVLIARKEETYPALVKGLLLKTKFTTLLEEEEIVGAIQLIREAEQKESGVTQAILQSVLGQFYQTYFELNFWRFQDRTEPAQAQSDDITTWSGDQLLKESNRLYLSSVHVPGVQEAPLDDWSLILDEGENADGLRITVYDLLMDRAIRHFRNSRSMLAEPASSYRINRREAFAAPEDFSRFPLTRPNDNSQTAQAVRLFQEWISYLLIDTSKVSALIDADLARLDFVLENAWLSDKEQWYRGALIRLIGEHPKEPNTSEAWYRLATLLKNKGDRFKVEQDSNLRWAYRDAIRICQLAMRDFRGSYGAKQARNLIASIERKALDLESEKVYLPGDPLLFKVDYRNVERMYVRLLRLNPILDADFKELPYWDRSKWLSQQRANWEMRYTLEGTDDYQPHSTEVALPAQSPGRYVVMLSDNNGFSSENGAFSYAVINVSELSYLELKSRDAEPSIIVVNRRTGAPEAGVTLEVYNAEEGKVNTKKLGSFVSDVNGMVSANVLLRTPYRFVLKKGDDELDPDLFLYRYGTYPQRNGSQRVIFFTDRSIYRPGQTIYFKGLILNYDRKGIPSIATNTDAEIQLLDANRQKVSQLSLESNGYGTFQGSFTIPTTGLLGNMQLRATLGGLQSIRVEEYKRPQFEVILDTLEGAYALGDTIQVNGEALGYAGNTIDGAVVNYRVTRQAYYPWGRFGRSYFPNQGPPAQVGYGESYTDSEGRFSFRFLAEPSYEGPSDAQPAYLFRIEADVVDITGETHTGQAQIRLSEKRIVPDFALEDHVAKGTNLPMLAEINTVNGQSASAALALELSSLAGPGKPLTQRYWKAPDYPLISKEEFEKKFPDWSYQQEHDPKTWPINEQVTQKNYELEGRETILLPTAELPVGFYRLKLNVIDEGSQDTIAFTRHFYVFDPTTNQLPAELETHMEWENLESLKPGDQTGLRLYTTAEEQQVWVELGQFNAIRNSQWLKSGSPSWSYLIQEEDKGDLYLQTHWVRNNRYHQEVKRIPIAWADKELTISYETFRDKIKPGAEETWEIKISGSDGEALRSEVLAAMYDLSLDQFTPHNWNSSFFPTFTLGHRWEGILFGTTRSVLEAQNWQPRAPLPIRRYPSFKGIDLGSFRKPELSSMPMDPTTYDAVALSEADTRPRLSENKSAPSPPPPAPPTEEVEETLSTGLGNQVRRDLRETAFFFPQLETDAQGNLSLNFEMGESLSRWKFMLFAHTRDMKFAYETREVVTQKELMVMPSVPRFLREGDQVRLSAKVVNMSDKPLSGAAKLELEDPVTGKSVASLLGHEDKPISFELDPGASSVVGWTITIPEEQLTSALYRIVGEAGAFSDGEQNVLPVISNKSLVTETLPVDMGPDATVSLEWEALNRALGSKSAKPKSLTLEVTSNPSWLAVKALPYIMEFPHECTEQLFNRFYANALAAHLANSNPAIQAVYEDWQRKGQLESPLSENQELKNVLLTETPWLQDALSEKQQLERLALLFNRNHLAQEQADVMAKLQERQNPDGGFSWFPGGPTNWYISQYLLEGMGRLDQLNILTLEGDPEQLGLVEQVIEYADKRVLFWYKNLKAESKKGNLKMEEDHLASLIIHWLYTRSQFPTYSLNGELREAKDYILSQMDKYWTKKSLQLQVMTGIASHRWGKLNISSAVVASLKERSIQQERGGITWKGESGWAWHQHSIETQALIIDFFKETNQEAYWLEGARTWLLNHKQVNRWETTKATASAIFALLISNKTQTSLTTTEPVEVTFSSLKKADYKENLDQALLQAEAGVGYFKTSWPGKEVNPDFAKVKFKNPNDHRAWASLYWQYLEQNDQIKASDDGPLTLTRTLMVERVTDKGRVLEQVDASAPLKKGEKLIIRLTLRVENEMDFVHLQVQRPACSEPIITESGYQYQGGLGYYESIRDAADHFFFESLPKGTHVLEYPLRIVHSGTYSIGIGQLQSMYAPQFQSRTAGGKVVVE